MPGGPKLAAAPARHNKKPHAKAWGFSFTSRREERGSGRHFHARSLGALRALGDFELHALAFLQAAEALGVDGREMDEHVLPAVFRRDEAKALGVVEPLDRTETH